MTSVKEGRCPKLTNCIQAGTAKIDMDFAVGDQVSPVTLEGKGICEDESGKCGSMVEVKDYKIKLLYLYPYPTADNNGKRDYKAKVIITKK